MSIHCRCFGLGHLHIFHNRENNVMINTFFLSFNVVGQSSALPPVLTLAAFPSHTERSASPDLPEDPRNEISQRTPSGDETSTETTTITTATIHLETVTNAVYTMHSSVATPQHIVMPAPSPSGIQLTCACTI